MNNKLSIQDLISALATRNGMDAKSAAMFVKTVFEIIEEYISKDKLVKIKGLGTFKLVSVSDRESVNVNTGERILIAGHSKLSFTPDTSLKDAINRPFSDFETTVLNENTSTEDMERIPSSELTDIAENDELDSDTENGFMEEDNESANIEPNPIQAEQSKQVIAAEPETVNMPTENTYPTEITALSGQAENTDGEETASIETEPETAENTEKKAKQDATNDTNKEEDVFEAKLMIVMDTDKSSEDAHQQDNDLYPMAAENISQTNTDKHHHGWLYTLLTLLLMAVSYVCGHYHIHEMIDINFYPEGEKEEHPLVKPIRNDEPKDMPISQDSVSRNEKDSLGHDSIISNSNVTKPQTRKTMQEDPAEVAKYFPQIPNGSYWIVGDAGRIHLMKVGETLYKVAKEELGNRDLVRYIIAFNKFEDPNIIHTGDTIRIPKLVKKENAGAQ